MTIAGTQLYNNEDQEIYPITHANFVDIKDITINEMTVNNVGSAIEQLLNKLNNLNGTQNNANSLKVECKYIICGTSDKTNVENIDIENWTNDIDLTKFNEINRFIWKKTIFKFGDVSTNPFYEVIAIYPLNLAEYLYTSSPLATCALEVPYFVQDHEDNWAPYNPTEKDNINWSAFEYGDGKTHNNTWKNYPPSLGGTSAYLFMVILDTDANGNKSFRSVPALIGMISPDVTSSS